MTKPETNQKHFWVEKPQTDVITFNHEKTFRDRGSGFVVEWQCRGKNKNYK